MTQVSITWQVEELDLLDPSGRRMCRVIETDHRDDADHRYTLPCIVVEPFVRARRQYVARTMRDDGAFRVEDHFDLPNEMKE